MDEAQCPVLSGLTLEEGIYLLSHKLHNRGKNVVNVAGNWILERSGSLIVCFPSIISTNGNKIESNKRKQLVKETLGVPPRGRISASRFWRSSWSSFVVVESNCSRYFSFIGSLLVSSAFSLLESVWCPSRLCSNACTLESTLLVHSLLSSLGNAWIWNFEALPWKCQIFAWAWSFNLLFKNKGTN